MPSLLPASRLAFAPSTGLVLCCLAVPAGWARTQEPVTAFRDVTVIPMTGAPVLAGRTVLVRGERIAAEGPSDSLPIPDDATVIDGAGRYLLPGLADMHVHLPGADSTGRATRNTLALFLANGVTTIRVMSGAARHLAVRDSVALGLIPGPRMYVAGSGVGALPGSTNDLRRVMNRAELAQFAGDMKRAGYDFIQITGGMLRQEYDALAASARRAGIRLTGGVPPDAGLDRVVRARQASVENLDGFLLAAERDDSPVRHADPFTRTRALPQYFDPRKLVRIGEAMRDAGIASTPTLFLTYIGYTNVAAEHMAQWPEMRYVAPPILEDWIRRKQRADERPTDANDVARLLSFRMAATRALAETGALLLVGSDAPSVFLVPGFATLYEMHSLTVAGVPLADVLRAATRHAAEFLGAEREFGAIAPGLAADLVLLDADPLADVANLTERAGVMVRGRWLPADELARMLDGVANTTGVGAARVRDR